MKKIAETKITNSSLTTVPKAVKMFLVLNNGDSIEWCINENHEIAIKKVKRVKNENELNPKKVQVKESTNIIRE